MKLTITTWYETESENEGVEDTQRFKAFTRIDTDKFTQSLFYTHNEKVGAIERKLLKSNE